MFTRKFIKRRPRDPERSNTVMVVAVAIIVIKVGLVGTMLFYVVGMAALLKDNPDSGHVPRSQSHSGVAAGVPSNNSGPRSGSPPYPPALKLNHPDHNRGTPRPQPTASKELPGVILITYYRGGSSFLGKLFDLYRNPNNPSCMYWFEPLIGTVTAFLSKYGRQRSVAYNGYDVEGMTNVDEIKELQRSMSDVISNIFTCNVTSLPRDELLRHPFVTGTTISRRVAIHYRGCLKGGGKNADLGRLDVCLPRLEQSCLTAEYRAVKLIRMSMKWAVPLLSKHRKLKVIHYTRDPRGTLLSRLGLQTNYFRDAETFGQRAKELCDQMRQDLDETELVQNTDPELYGRVLRIRYEDLALDPVKTATQIYDFLDLEFPKGIRDWLLKYTKETDPKGLATSVHRNASHVASKWRQGLDPAYQALAAEHCNEVLYKLGYDTDL